MKFGDKLLCSQHPPWSDHYIDYIRLKQLLHTLFESADDDLENGGHYGGAAGADGGKASGDINDRQPLLPPPSFSGNDNIKNGGSSSVGGANVHDAPVLHYGSTTFSNITITSTPPPTSCTNTNIHRTTSVSSTQSFEMELKYEIQKALLFLLRTLGELSTDLSSLLKRHHALEVEVHHFLDTTRFGDAAAGGSGGVSFGNGVGGGGDARQHQQIKTHLLQDIENLRLDFIVRIGSTLLLLLEFVELNIEAIVKIVKKHDKFLSKWEKTEGKQQKVKATKMRKNCTRLRRQYLPRFAVYSSDPNVRCLFLAAADAGDCSGTSKAGIRSSASLQLSTAMRKESGNFGGWDVMQWNLEVALRELFEWEQQLRCGGKMLSDDNFGGNGSFRDERPMPPRPSSATVRSYSVSTLNGPKAEARSRHRNRPSAIENFLTRSTTLLNINSNVLSSLRSGSSAVLSSLKLTPSHANLAVDNTTSTFFEPMLYRIQSHRHRIGQMHDRYTRMVYAHEMLYLIGDTKQIQREDANYLLRGQEEFGSVEKLENIRRQSIGGDLDGKRWMEEGYLTTTTTSISRFSKLLNLASASLYMCNYNIVAPTSGLYAKMLGFDPACAGIIIGMTPMAVIVSCVLYSWWSSHSYKRAIIFASFSCIVGNLVYALALPCKSMKMVLIGRLLTGFGSARVINRRYIADYYSIEDRTSGMVDLVTASALGSAVGPAIAASLSLIAPANLSGTNTYWTIETAPGYVMFFLWSILCICYVVFFEEPERDDPIKTKPPTMSTEIQLVKGGSPSATTYSEKKPLLSIGVSNYGAKCFQPEKLLRSCNNVPVLISLMLLVLLKAVLEGLSSSAPTVSRYYFGWGVHANGIFLAALASFVLPTNFFVAHISRRFDDRELIIATLAVMLFGILGVLNYGEGSGYSEVRFVLFGLVIFVSCNALEGPTMGLLSKTIPKSLAKGILNAGLLSTEAGTVGRVLGDIWFSSSTFMGLDQMLNRTFGPMSVMVALSICAVLWSYSNLQPTFEVDSEDDSEDGDGDNDDDD